jgi:hypothetical protein
MKLQIQVAVKIAPLSLTIHSPRVFAASPLKMGVLTCAAHTAMAYQPTGRRRILAQRREAIIPAGGGWHDNVLQHVLASALLTSKTRQRDNAHPRDPQSRVSRGIFALSKGVISVQKRRWSFRWQTG